MSDTGRPLPVHRPWWLLRPGHVSPWWWLPIGALLVTLDFLTGLSELFLVVYMISVTVAAWYSGRTVALVLSAGPAVRLVVEFVSGTIASPSLPNAVAYTGMGFFLSLVFTRFAGHEQRLERQIRVLEGLLPICSFCKSIRDGAGDWQPLESYIQDRSDAKFSHGLCPNCVRRHYEEPRPRAGAS